MSDSSPEENHEANERPNTPTQSQSDNPATNNDGVQKGPRGKRNKSNANQASAPLGKVSLKPKIRQKKSGSLVPAPKKQVNSVAEVPGPTPLRRRAVTSAVGALPAKQKGESHKPPLRRFSSETFWHSWDRSPQQIYKTINPITGEIQCRTYSSTFTVQEDQGDDEDDEEEDDEEEEEEIEDEISGEEQILDSKEKEVEEISSKESETQPQEKKKDKGKSKSKLKSKSSKGKSKRKRTVKDKSAKEEGGDATIAEREKQMKKQMLINMREYSKTLTTQPATRGGSLIIFKSGSSGSPATRHSFSTPSPSPSPSTLTPRDLMAELIIDLWPSSAPSPREGGEAKESNVSAGSLDALVAAFFGDIGRDQLGN